MRAATGRKSRWRHALGLSLALGFSGWQVAAVFAQQPPTIPETTVEGTPPTTAPTLPPTTEAPTPSPSPAAPFTSPPAVGYKAGSETTGTKIDLPQLSFPGTVDVVPRSVFYDQQILRTDELLRDVPGVTKFSDPRRPDDFSIRGFEVTSRDFRKNGFLDPTAAPREYADVERVEILKGPASVLYGSGQPSGIVNLITKKPLADSYNNAQVTGGSFGLFRFEADSTGPLNEAKTLLYRINFAYQNYDGFRDFDFNERTFVAPAFTWLIDENNSITFQGEYLNDRRHFDTGLVNVNNTLGLLPITRSFNEPTDFARSEDYHTFLFFNHRFNDDWTMRLGAAVEWYSLPFFGTVPVATGAVDPRLGLPATTLLRQVQDAQDFREQNYAIIADLAGKFCTGPIEHKLLVGAELDWYNSTNFTVGLSDPLQPVQLPGFPFPIPVPSSPIDVFHPRYGGPVPPLTGHFDADYTQERYGFYVQDLVDFNHKVQILGGLRGDIVDFSFARELVQPFGGQDAGFPRVENDETFYHLTPRVGIVYQPIEDVLSLYTTYSLSFDPPPGGAFRNPTPLRPETGRIVEGGIKADLLNKQLSLTMAGFYIVKDNVTTADTFFFATQIGEQRAQGVEMSAVGKLTDRWSVIGNYAYIDSRILKEADPTLVGDRFRGIPFNNANLWTRYNLIQEACQTFGLGLGVVYNGDRPGDLGNSFNLPGYVRWDAGIYYKRNAFNAAVYFENIFDQRYYTGSVDSLTIYPGAPFTVRASIGVTF
jgi:iron complex outermembrane receptor protein